MDNLSDILNFFEAELESTKFKDASLNGLQVEGKARVRKIAASVDCGLSVVQKASAINADLLLVHHGLFWGQVLAVQGAHKNVVKSLLESEISLVAQHLPLDASPEYGNNYSLARILELKNLQPSAEYHGQTIGCLGENSGGSSLKEIVDKLHSSLDGCEDIKTLSFGPSSPQRVCIVSGSAADQLYRFAEEGFDTFITGEPKQFAYHYCKDNKLNAIFAGHYATETAGVKNLAKAAAKKFSIEWEFIDEPTGI
jgi:dinuclear metal center YbgI/SA1388 family protein